MGRPYGSRTTLAICGALAILLGRVAVVQYRWATQVAAADAQREKEHLESSASLFATQYNGIGAQAAGFLQNEAWPALQSGEKLSTLPKLLAEVYFLDLSARGGPKGRRLTSEGLFIAAPLPEWAVIPRCDSLAIQQPPALVAPVFDMSSTESQGATGSHAMNTFWQRADRCFVARLDQTYLRDVLFPQLIHQSFGETSASEYDFAVVWRNRPGDALYGGAIVPDLRKPFFSIGPSPFSKGRLADAEAPGPSMVVVQQMASMGLTRGALPLFGPGVWELDVAHKGVPLAVAFEMTRHRNLGMGLGVVVLLFAAIVFLVVLTQRMQRLANRKMQFVAGVSHELRTPVSAIAMLSRNQADGLVVGAERVRQYGELIHQQSRRLNEMVEQTLQYAGIHSGLREPDKNTIDLGQLIQETVDARQEELARAGFQVEIALGQDLPAVQGDAKLLRTAVDNLLSNAQKYAECGHWICVRAGYSAAEKEVLLSVEDRGPGIDAADRAEIFEPFSRGRAAIEAQIPGSGLGLSLVRSAMEAHRGSVTLVSEPGRGSTFTMHLPV
jgi:signal transduction histidine kinase